MEKNIDSGKCLTIKPDSLNSKEVSNLLKEYHISKILAVFRNRYSKSGNLIHETNESTIYRQIIINDSYKANELAKLLLKAKGVKEAYIETPIQFNSLWTPNDANYSGQWYLNASYSPVADIRAAQAWDINTGRSDVIIAVCDGGVDYTHSDLDPGDRTRVIAGYDSGDDDNDPMDDLPDHSSLSYAGHGTHVAGIIGARTNNSINTSGIMWNCKIMPVKMVRSGSVKLPFIGTIWDFSTTAFPSDVADAIDYAVNNGANVINLSYGFNSMGFPINEVILRVPLLYSAISNAYNQNVVVVAAMGNEYQAGNPIEYPAAFGNEVIAVGASTETLTRWSESNTGPHIDVSAPGTNILSTNRGGGVITHSGTSMATPVVSGIAGLIISQGKDHSFNLTNDDVRHILELTADDMGSSGFDQETGYGKVNAFSALTLINNPNTVVHGNSLSGTSVLITTLNPWIYSGENRWNLSEGSYYSVDEYQITKHINFAIPFCSIPKVWIRDRECISLSFANPNVGFPWAEISNVTTTGFDVRYAVYYVRYNYLGQTINNWVPSTIANSKIEYTAVGVPNIAATTGPITGYYLVCSSGTSYSISNVPPGHTITWSSGSYLTRVSPQGSNPCTFTSNGNGSSYIGATISSDCGPAFQLTNLTVWAGKFESTVVSGTAAVCPNSLYTYTAQVPGGHSSSYSYSWTYPSGWSNYGQVQNAINLKSPQYSMTYGPVRVAISNSCGTSGYSGITVYPRSGCGGYFSIYPNPASDNVTINMDNISSAVTTVDADLSNVDIANENVIKSTNFTIRIYNSQGTLISTKIRSGLSFDIPLINMRDGTYIIEVSDGKNISRQQLIVKHN